VSFIDRVTTMAAKLGLGECEVAGESVRLMVSVDGADPVAVFVRPCGEMHGKEVLEFSSAGLTLPDDDASKMPLLILALQRNADVMLGHWGLDEQETASLLRVFHSQITETMDLPEFRGAVLAVADEFATLKRGLADVLTEE
jgi:hypothetical protein